jgi:hypothetical protein
VPRLRLLVALLSIGLAAITWAWTVADLHAWRQHSVLDSRGVTTTATVLSYSYDPAGGDPGGWTTDRVSFTTAGGTAVVATVGHHDPGAEQASRVLDVTYDPRHPTLARAAHYVDDADDPANAVVGAVLAAGFSAFAALLTSRVVTRRPYRRIGGRAGEVIPTGAHRDMRALLSIPRSDRAVRARVPVQADHVIGCSPASGLRQEPASEGDRSGRSSEDTVFERPGSNQCDVSVRVDLRPRSIRTKGQAEVGILIVKRQIYTLVEM